MAPTHIEKFAEFATASASQALPHEVAEESKRIILDTVGCALAATDNPAGRAGVDYGRVLGGERDEATIIGVAGRTSVHGAAFANAELMNALDFEPIALPGHVAPYVVPVALAMGEGLHRPGGQVVAAVAVCHEMSYRFAKAMDKNRDVKDGKAHTSPVLGYSSTVFGTTAAAAMLKGMQEEAVADALGIAGATSPVNGHRAWLMHAPSTTIKNSLMPGGVAMSGMTAAYMADLGHRGDKRILDDEEFGYPRFIGTRRWEPSELTSGLGIDWRFPSESFFKPYPHCRVPHALFDALIEVVRANDIKPGEIESLTAWGEEWVGQFPTFMSDIIERPYDAQFSFVHGLALAAHLVPPGKEWHDPSIINSPSVLGLKTRIAWKAHPDWATAVSKDPSARPSRVEVVARGTTFVGERRYPKGSPSPDPSTYMTTDALVQKFHHNAEGVLAAQDAEAVVDSLLHLEQVDDLCAVMERLRLIG
ncbi:MmgE/PrpD family protein [Geodermatophilus sp. CPCC 205506]|uniref:MmgE/PrpD family protein n=1 Tax=Geodermatophilus sp. CPCC 205506 TaxID=2936596 RepID=UPI003EE8E135